ncbi:MAG: hypothetical protein D3906_03140, partial [Candidatus Electrothrix sp. AUS1_2]|nr:hypothetical protein [Candidatus Electrothrix sp. AUS1_2]
MKYRFVLSAVVCLFGSLAVTSAHEIPEGAVPFAKSEECASCHPTIYKEWQESFHAKSSALVDPAHGAVHKAFLK